MSGKKSSSLSSIITHEEKEGKGERNLVIDLVSEDEDEDKPKWQGKRPMTQSDDENEQLPKKKRLRRLCDIIPKSDHDEKSVIEERIAIEKKVMRLSTNRLSEKLEKRVVALAIRSREIGFNRDQRIITGDVRDMRYKRHNIAILIFETVRRSLACSWVEAKKEWETNKEMGEQGHSDGSIDAIGSYRTTNESKTTISSDDSEPIEGQCTCLFMPIKYRYHIINQFTEEQMTLGSECIKQFSPKLFKQYKETAKSVWQTVKPCKWLYI